MNKLSLFTCISLKRHSAPLKNNQKSEDLIQLCFTILVSFCWHAAVKGFLYRGNFGDLLYKSGYKWYMNKPLCENLQKMERFVYPLSKTYPKDIFIYSQLYWITCFGLLGGRLLQGRMNKNMVINEADGESWQDGTQVIVFFGLNYHSCRSESLLTHPVSFCDIKNYISEQDVDLPASVIEVEKVS